MSNPDKQNNLLVAVIAGLMSVVGWLIAIFLLLGAIFALNDWLKKHSRWDLSQWLVYGMIALFVLSLFMAAFGPLPNHSP